MATNTTTSVFDLHSYPTDGDRSKFPAIDANHKVATSKQVGKSLRDLSEAFIEYPDDELCDSTFTSLPDRYCLFYVKRRKDDRYDRYLIGHPGGERFRSAAEFVEHAVTMIVNRDLGTNDWSACPCGLCVRQRERNHEE